MAQTASFYSSIKKSASTLPESSDRAFPTNPNFHLSTIEVSNTKISEANGTAPQIHARTRPGSDQGGAPHAGDGFERSSAYIDWCWANGFEGSLEKSGADLMEEREAYQHIQARRVAHSRLHRNPKAFLKAVCSGDLSSDDIDRPIFKQAAAVIEASKEDAGARSSLLDMLLQLSGHGDFVFQTVADRSNTPFLRGLIKLHDHKALWLRPLEEWKPKSKNHDKMFGELTHHLFDQYGDVPTFMESVWLRDDRPSWRFRDWYVLWDAAAICARRSLLSR